MPKDDEAQPKRTRRRRTTYPKRVELRMTDEGYALAESSAARLSEDTGRTITVSDVIRAAVDDGCKALARTQERAASTPASGPSIEQLDAVVAAMQEVRDEVRRLGQNVNQIARVTHSTGAVPDGLTDTAKALAALDQRVLRLGMSALGYETTDDEGEG